MSVLERGAGQGQLAPYITLRNVSKQFRDTKKGLSYIGVTDVNLDISRGSFVSIVGPSGCGKSTLLTLISGLSSPTSGDVNLEGQQVVDVMPNMGFMFQKDALFPWKTVLGNVELPLVLRKKMHPKEMRERALDWISRVGLKGFEHHYPHQLSGGMRKRVSMAQTFVYQPEVILMDEPFSALDVHTRNNMENELLEIWNYSKCTVVFVTHDLEEAIALSTHVVVFTASPGRVKSVYNINLPHPRKVDEIKFDDAFSKLHHAIWKDLREEVGKHWD